MFYTESSLIITILPYVESSLLLPASPLFITVPLTGASNRCPLVPSISTPKWKSFFPFKIRLPKLLVILPLQPFSLVEEVVVDALPETVPVLLIFPEEI
ncbi:hypothetical protein [Lysinibacillus pakistanensis]|uniref:hypothetical protein n=1 Tax=Lysinibacillus pakistanensis TaxID=759811 RepID=UPI003D27EE12